MRAPGEQSAAKRDLVSEFNPRSARRVRGAGDSIVSSGERKQAVVREFKPNSVGLSPRSGRLGISLGRALASPRWQIQTPFHQLSPRRGRRDISLGRAGHSGASPRTPGPLKISPKPANAGGPSDEQESRRPHDVKREGFIHLRVVRLLTERAAPFGGLGGFLWAAVS